MSSGLYNTHKIDFDTTLDLTRLKPYGDTMNDGKVQTSFTLPVKDDARGEADGAYARVAAAADQINEITRRQDGYLKTVSTMQADVGRLADAMQKAASELRASAASVERSHIQANKALQEEFGSTMDAYRDYVNQFTQRVDYLASNISGALQAMPDAVSEANNRFLDQVDRMTDAMVQAQRALEVTADRLYRG